LIINLLWGHFLYTRFNSCPAPGANKKSKIKHRL
jgi:hypothetical protein